MLAHAQSLSRQLVALQRLLLLLQILYLLYKPFVFRFTVLPVLFQIYDSDLDQSFPDFSLYRFNLLVKLSGWLLPPLTKLVFSLIVSNSPICPILLLYSKPGV